ncbi:sensor histidine kinase [Halorientalis pallida]|uniref:histidine kinase n=1 Tax=Halorientalis pallida TaxID=2479928 RepID=A0A498KT64_9EURY|nr:HAMP domain-containing sensor histidine kinase [Halorientalis pallida]RXK47285.1 HAMP domain-containing histidine kinase [Halorientalis pallida]
MVAVTVLKGALLGSGIVAVLGAYGLWLWGRSQRTQVSLADTATAAWADCAPPAARLTVEVDTDLAVSADPEKLTGLFEALFENTVEYGGRDVTVRLVRTRDGFAVEDDGPGIPDGEREQVFELGYTTRADRQGLGLGMVRTLCHAYGWAVEVDESDEGGARIVVSDVRFYSTWETDGDETVARADASA